MYNTAVIVPVTGILEYGGMSEPIVGNRFSGVIRNDVKRRFNDGVVVSTSPVTAVVSTINPNEDLVITKNSVYLVRKIQG